MNDNQMEDLTASSSAASSCAEVSRKLEDSSEAFQFPKRRKRPSTAISSVSSGATIITTAPLQPTLTVILKPTDPDKSLAKINPLKISEKLEMTAPDGVILVRPNRRLNLLAIDWRNTESTKALLKLESIGGIPVQAYAPHSREAAKGVIYGVQEDISDVQLESSVRATAPVLCLRRLGKSEVVKLVFSTNTLPAYITIGYTRYNVEPFIEKPRQCPNCSSYGHIRGTCLKTSRCSRCGGAHDRSKCDTEDPRCINCGKKHESTSRQCPKFKLEQNIYQYKNYAGMDYKSARSAILSSNEKVEVNPPDTTERRHHQNHVANNSTEVAGTSSVKG
ncbi:uncharacterized protein LOC120841324 [Ixodes scapularis]|uniref:uncharacterized protein LOC120841324 n=1 Tax=Ixodes scapularis TaxID=6945 RepID=UPI001A9E39B6|nr:uncharacterized protein LOC120841324 [Ixodes scapularis]